MVKKVTRQMHSASLREALCETKPSAASLREALCVTQPSAASLREALCETQTRLEVSA